MDFGQPSQHYLVSSRSVRDPGSIHKMITSSGMMPFYVHEHMHAYIHEHMCTYTIHTLARDENIYFLPFLRLEAHQVSA